MSKITTHKFVITFQGIFNFRFISSVSTTKPLNNNFQLIHYEFDVRVNIRRNKQSSLKLKVVLLYQFLKINNLNPNKLHQYEKTLLCHD